jgi:predicted molibdopterin-dependent oxidoreductase YjgC
MDRMGFDHVFESIKALGFKVPDEKQSNNNQITPEQAFQEAGLLWPGIRGMTYQRLKSDGLQWPCPTQSHPGTPYLFKGTFPVGKAAFRKIMPTESNELPDGDYPFILTTGRILFQYHTGTMTRRSKGLEAVAPESFVEINNYDAEQMGIKDEEMVKVSSRRGSITLKAKVGDRVGKGVLFVPFHYHEASANVLTNDALDPISKIAEAKVCAVRLEKTDKRRKEDVKEEAAG